MPLLNHWVLLKWLEIGNCSRRLHTCVCIPQPLVLVKWAASTQKLTQEGSPHSTQFEQVNKSCPERRSVWTLASRCPLERHHRVDAATRQPMHAPSGWRDHDHVYLNKHCSCVYIQALASHGLTSALAWYVNDYFSQTCAIKHKHDTPYLLCNFNYSLLFIHLLSQKQYLLVTKYNYFMLVYLYCVCTCTYTSVYIMRQFYHVNPI